MDKLINQPDILKNLTNNVNKNCHSSRPLLGNMVKNSIIKKRLQVFSFQHPQPSTVLLLS